MLSIYKKIHFQFMYFMGGDVVLGECSSRICHNIFVKGKLIRLTCLDFKLIHFR